MGVNKPKKIRANTMGLTTFPIKRPKCIQVLFKGESKLDLNTATILKRNDNIKKVYETKWLSQK